MIRNGVDSATFLLSIRRHAGSTAANVSGCSRSGSGRCQRVTCLKAREVRDDPEVASQSDSRRRAAASQCQATPVLAARGRDATLATFSAHFEKLGAQLLSLNQNLTIDVLNIDLAGEYEPWRRNLSDVRIMRDVTPSYIKLSYVLNEKGKRTLNGEDDLTDINYQMNPSAPFSSDRYGYEKALLDDWFRRVVAHHALKSWASSISVVNRQIDDVAALEACIVKTSGPIHLKVMDHLDDGARRWLAASPLMFAGFGSPVAVAVTKATARRDRTAVVPSERYSQSWGL